MATVQLPMVGLYSRDTPSGGDNSATGGTSWRRKIRAPEVERSMVDTTQGCEGGPGEMGCNHSSYDPIRSVISHIRMLRNQM